MEAILTIEENYLKEIGEDKLVLLQKENLPNNIFVATPQVLNSFGITLSSYYLFSVENISFVLKAGVELGNALSEVENISNVLYINKVYIKYILKKINKNNVIKIEIKEIDDLEKYKAGNIILYFSGNNHQEEHLNEFKNINRLINTDILYKFKDFFIFALIDNKIGQISPVYIDYDYIDTKYLSTYNDDSIYEKIINLYTLKSEVESAKKQYDLKLNSLNIKKYYLEGLLEEFKSCKSFFEKICIINSHQDTLDIILENKESLDIRNIEVNNIDIEDMECEDDNTENVNTNVSNIENYIKNIKNVEENIQKHKEYETISEIDIDNIDKQLENLKTMKENYEQEVDNINKLEDDIKLLENYKCEEEITKVLSEYKDINQLIKNLSGKDLVSIDKTELLSILNSLEQKAEEIRNSQKQAISEYTSTNNSSDNIETEANEETNETNKQVYESLIDEEDSYFE